MMETLQIFGLLLRKNWLIRKKHWILYMFGQILLPVCLMFIARLLYDSPQKNPEDLDPDFDNVTLRYSRKLLDKSSIPIDTIFYVPKNKFIKELISIMQSCRKLESNFQGFQNENELSDNLTLRSIAIVFNETTDYATKHFKYAILINRELNKMYTKWNVFERIQICLDESFIKIKSNATNYISQMFIQRLPRSKNELIRLNQSVLDNSLYTILLMIIFSIPQLIETVIATHEKFKGINVLMSMNGISSTLNLSSWVVSGLLPLCIFSLLSTLVAFIRLTEKLYNLEKYADCSLILTIHAVHMLSTVTFGIHISAYFTKPLSMVFALISLNTIAVVLRTYILEDEYQYLVHYVGIMLPNIYLYQAMLEIYSFKSGGFGTRWRTLFVIPYEHSTVQSSIGKTLIFSVMGVIFHFLLAIHMYTINPGQYGVGKHPLFFYKNKHRRRDNSIVNLIYSDMNDQFFEPTSMKTLTPVIQIRNLKKSYSINFFSKKKVHALRGISIDIFKGQITSLLGHNGAGKSTLMSILTNMISANDGTVFMNSKNLEADTLDVLKDVGLCAQEDMHFSNLTVSQQLEFFATVKRKDRSAIQKSVGNLIHKLKLVNVKDAPPNNLSEDQKRKLSIGMALAGEPDILLLDEPTSRLDYESKRLIWDLLLEMKGKQTILISTHDMQEADILADRVAIMHNGQLKSYGTTTFLKKMTASQNNFEVTMYIEQWSDPEIIRQQIDNTASVIEKQAKKIILSVPASVLSSTLERLERKKSDLGVCSYSLSLISMEQVFLKVTRENDSPLSLHTNMIYSKEKLKGASLYIQSVRALLLKNVTYAFEESTTLMIQISTIFLVLLVFSIPLAMTKDFELVEEVEHPIIQDVRGCRTFYTSSNQTIGEQYKRACKIHGIDGLEIINANLYDDLTKRASEDRNYNAIAAAAEFNDSSDGLIVNALYHLSFGLPVSINLISNTIIKNLLGADYSITSSILTPRLAYEEKYHVYYMLGLWSTAIFVTPLYFLMATFIIHPARESSRGLKHLQKMTGVSGFTYWATMFLSDMFQYTFLVILLVLGIICVDYFFDFRFCEIKIMMILILLLMMYAGNALPLVYVVSFMNTKTKRLVKLLTFTPIATGIIEIIMLIFPVTNTSLPKGRIHSILRYYQKSIFLLLPHTSFLTAQIAVHTTNIRNARCKKLSNQFYDDNCLYKVDYCCRLNCYDGKCQSKELYSDYEYTDVDFVKSLYYLCIMPVLHFCLLVVLEAQLFQKIKAKFRRQNLTQFPMDERVMHEKSMIFQTIQTLIKKENGNKHEQNTSDDLPNKLLLTYELCRRYKETKAVEDVSLSVDRQECFGILGVNRAGKSVAIRMITGEEIPDHGTMFMEDKHFKNSKKFVLSQIGYCPQEEALIKCLNSHEHLRLFARLRGIPEDQLENEVEFWIRKLNLSACASFPSSTYSNGNKQRLNIAIALIGNPNLIVLDEPTIRIDPDARQTFWNIIKNCQAAGQTILIATHNMEECEALCNRMAIMVEGKLTHFGTPDKLKQIFGDGYDVQIRLDPRKISTQLDELKNAMRLLLPCTLTHENLSSLMYHVFGLGTTWQKLYDVLNKIKNKYDCIDDYIVVVRLMT